MISFEAAAWDDYLFWQQHGQQLLRKLNQLLRDVQRDPFAGLGKPEPLKGDLSGFWSRRINDEHRVVYKWEAGELLIAQCRGHYD